jgi:oligopeptidase B
MRIAAFAIPVGLALLASACATMQPPVAKIVPERLEENGNVRIDDYYWLKERDNPEVISYLESENAYTRAVMRHTRGLQKKLFGEIKNRIKPNDESVPYLYDGYYYYTRFERGREYAIYCRKPGSLDAPEEIMLDGNELAGGHEFFAVRRPEISSGRDILAFGVDTVGRRFYTLYFKNLTTGRMYPDAIPDVTGVSAWANDNRTLFYSKQDPETLRPWQIYRHTLGTDPATDALVYTEKDETFRCYVTKTKSRRYLLIISDQTLSTEVRFLDAEDPTGIWRVFLPRERDHEYSVEDGGDRFIIRTNWQAKNFRLMEAPVDDTSKDAWRDVVPHRPDVFLDEFEVFRDFLVLAEREDGLIRFRVIPWSGATDYTLDFGEPTYLASFGTNLEFDTPVLRYEYTSLVTPNSTYDYDMRTRQQTLRKRDEVLGGYHPEDYRTERLHAEARDGALVPISIVYPKDLRKDGRHPLLLYGYGSYGYSMDATFSSARLSLLERGFAFAIAHVRGGQELGRDWYEDGKLLHKKNTFTDFIDCAQYLVDTGYTATDRLFAMGGSAGGLLMGAVANMAPELFRGIIAQVPFVDIVTTMLDASIPLTTSEYDEWGDPADPTYYDYMLSYSPYDQVEHQDYPCMLVTTGLHDSQVQYWEPAKWVAKLRAFKTDRNLLLLDTNMEAGHGGASGRFKRHRETALAYAFMLDLLGIKD